MRITIGAGLLLCGLAASLWGSPAAAVGADDAHADQLYGAVSGLYEFPDGARGSQNGYGMQLIGGLPLVDHPGYAVELNLHALARKRSDGSNDYQYAILGNLVKDFGLYGWDGKWIPHFKPFVLGGIGAVEEDVLGDQRINPGIDLGGGLLFPLGFMGAAVRTEATAIGQYNHDKTRGDDQSFYADYHVLIGLEIPLGVSLHPMSSEPTPPPAGCELAVVDPISGRKDCSVDSDHDGVPDSIDQCPDTPAGSTVDDKGCVIAAGADGAAAAPTVAPDCTSAAPGVQVDDKGCAVTQTFALQPVHFDVNASTLTDTARTLLDGIAQTMKSQPDIRVEIGGHTDSQGSQAFNIKLSGVRAEAVRSYLVSKGVEGYRMTLKGYGSTQPVAPNTTEAGRAQNRRVEFRIEL